MAGGSQRAARTSSSGIDIPVGNAETDTRATPSDSCREIPMW